MKFTGERYLPNKFEESDSMSKMHLGRYNFAMQFIKDKNIIDIACGEGYGSNQLAGVAKTVTGIDIDNETIENAKLKYKKIIYPLLLEILKKLTCQINQLTQ